MFFLKKKDSFKKSNSESDEIKENEYFKKILEKLQQENRDYTIFLSQEKKEREKIKECQEAIFNTINKDLQEFNSSIKNEVDINDKKRELFDQEINNLLESNDLDELKKLINKTLG